MPALARIRRAVRAAIHANGGVDAAALTVGKSSTTVGNWNNRNLPATPTLGEAFALDEVAAEAGGTPPIAAAWAAELGCVLIRLPAATAGEGHALQMALVDAAAEFGDVAQRLRDALADGEVRTGERFDLVEQIDEALGALARMRSIAAGVGQ